jgi:hypothetical protein
MFRQLNICERLSDVQWISFGNIGGYVRLCDEFVAVAAKTKGSL